MPSFIHDYLRSHRRKWAITQRELAFLLGHKSPTHISRLEQGKRTPSKDIVFACEVLFGIPARSCFPKLYAEVEETVLARAATLYEHLDNETSKNAIRKKEFLSTALKRAITRDNKTKGV